MTTHKSKSKFQRKNINKYIFGIYTHTALSAGGVLGGGGLIIRRMQYNITLCTTMRLVHISSFFFYKLRVPPWVVVLQSRQSITAILYIENSLVTRFIIPYRLLRYTDI